MSRHYVIGIVVVGLLGVGGWNLLKFGQEYLRQSQETDEQEYQVRLMKSLAKQTEAME